MKRSCSAVPQRTGGPSSGSRQNHATSARSSNCWARLMRASGGISKERNSTRPSRPVGPSGENSLSMQISARWVLPVTSTSRLRNSRSTSQGGGGVALAGRRHLRERDLELVEHVLARLVDARRLAGRADEQAGEQIGERRVALPVEHQALEQVGPAQERAVGRRRAAEHDVIAAAGAGVAAVDHELVGAEPATGARPRRGRAVIATASRQRRRRMDVDLDDAGIGRHLDDAQCADRAAADSPRCGPAAPSSAAVASTAASSSR